MRFVKFNDNIIRALAAITIIALILLVLWWPRFLNAWGTIATALLLYVTLEYVLANRANVQLFREQLEQQRKVYVDFGAEVENRKPLLWVANLGTATFIVRSVQIRTLGKSLSVSTNVLVPSGKIERFGLPDETYNSALLVLDFDVSLECTGLESKLHTNAKAFHLLLAGGYVSQVHEGILLGWPMKCPQCDELVGLLKTDGLNNFDEAHGREKNIENELKKTCPQHRSPWLETAQGSGA